MADETPVTPTPPVTQAEPDPGILHGLATSIGIDPEAVKSAAKAIWANPVEAAKTIGGAQVDEFVDAAQHPVKTARLALNGVISSITNPEAQATAKARFNTPGFQNKIHGVGEYLTSGLPLVGGGYAKAEEQGAQGHIGEALGTIAGTTLPMVTGAIEDIPEKIHAAGAEARASMAARQEARIAEAKTGKVITIEPQKALPEAPKQLKPAPDMFAEAGGKLVGPNAPIEKPVSPVEKGIAATGPIEDLIMSDKIGGKKVRGAPPKSAEPVELGISPAASNIKARAIEDGGYLVMNKGKVEPADIEDHRGFLLSDGSFVGGAEPYSEDDDTITGLAHGDIANHLGVPDLHAANAIRLAGSNMFELYGRPTDHQLTEMARLTKESGERNVIWDFHAGSGVSDPGNMNDALENLRGKFIDSGHGSVGAFRRAVDKAYPEVEPEKFAEAGGKFVGKAPEPAAPAAPYHPDLQKIVDAPGVEVHRDPTKIVNPERGSFIGPDGQYITMPAGAEHDKMIDKIRPNALQEEDSRINFLNDTGAMRVRPAVDRAGQTLHISVPKDGVTPEQVDALKQAVGGGMKSRGNLLMDTADAPRNSKDTYKEMVSPADIDDELRKVGVHPDQQDIISKELQSPLKEKYTVEVTKPDGTSSMEPIDAFSSKNAIALARKKFPEANEWRIEKMGERAPSTEYSVPTGKLAAMRESAGRPVVHTIRHELGHAMVGQSEGLTIKGMLSSSHPLTGRDTRAAIQWDGTGLYDSIGRIRADKRTAVLKNMMGGIAADEVFNDLPRSANHNFPINAGGDGTQAYNILKAAGFSHDDAYEEMHKLIDAGVEYLKQPAVAGIIKENENFREAGLSRQFHYSPERLQNMHAEVQRRIANGEQPSATERPDNGTVGGAITEGRTGNVPAGEGGISQTGAAVAPEKGIVSEEKIKKTSKVTPEEQSAIDDYNKEKAFADEILAGKKKVEDFPYHAGYQQTITAESKLLAKGKTLFIGGGPVPLSSILLDRAGFPVDTLELDPETAKLGEKVARKSGMKTGQFIPGDARDFKKFSDYDNIVVALEAGPTGESKTGVLQTIIDQAKPGARILARGTAGKGGEAFVDVNKALPKGVQVAQSVPTFEGYGQTHVLHVGTSPVEHMQQGGEFGVLTAENPQNKTLSPEENAPRNEKLRQELVSRGYEPIQLTGHSKDVGEAIENPYFVKGISPTETAELGRKYGQQAVVTHQGLHDLNRDIVNPRDVTQKIITGKNAEQQDYFSKHQGQAFSVPIDFSKEQVPAGPSSDHTVSTRIPTKTVKGETVEDHTDQSRMSDIEAAKAAPGYMQKMVNRTNETPGFTAPDATAQEQADAYIRHAADNIKFVAGKVTPEEFKRDEQWYPVGAHERGQAVAKQHGFTPHQVYAVTSVESPMTDWDQNTSLAERTTNIWKNQQNTKFTPEMQKAADKITDLPANKAFKPYYKKLIGKTLAELPDTKLQAHWLRLYDEAHNPREYETWGPDGKSLGLAKNQDGSPKKVGWSFQSHIEKAIEVLKDGSDENISKQLGYGHKVRNFYNNQLAPDDPRFLTMDTHAINVAQLRPMSGKTKAVRENFGAIKNGAYGLKGTYPVHDAAYRLAAKELDIPIPGRLQSPTWVKIREVFTDDFKTPENQAAVDAIWKEHEDGKITADQARNNIWDYATRWNRENAARIGAASNQGKLFETGVRGEPAAGAAGRGTGVGTPGEVSAPGVDDTSFEFGANVKPAETRSRVSKISAAQKAKNDAMVRGLAGLINPSKK